MIGKKLQKPESWFFISSLWYHRPRGLNSCLFLFYWTAVASCVTFYFYLSLPYIPSHCSVLIYFCFKTSCLLVQLWWLCFFFFLGENGVFLWIFLGSRTRLQSILIPSQQLMFLWVLLYMLTIRLPLYFYHVLYIHTLKIVTANGQRDHPAAQISSEVAS